jgi:hypothetical protein
MSMNAMALVSIPWSQLVQALGAGEAPARAKTPDKAQWLTSMVGGAVLVHELDDGALVDLGHSIRDVEADELANALRAHLGPVLDTHGDDRGVFIFPEKIRPDATTSAGILEEIGEVGEWVELTPVAGMGMPDGLEAMMGNMLGGVDPSAMEGLFEQAQQMMADPDKAAQMMEMAAQMMGGPDGGLDMGALQEQAQKMAQANPELIERLKGLEPPKDD